MKLPDLQALTDLDILSQFYFGLAKVTGLILASGSSFFIANAIPEEIFLGKEASIITGWGLALVTIITLSKVVKALFKKLEERDDIIHNLHKLAIDREQAISNERLKALEEERHRNR